MQTKKRTEFSRKELSLISEEYFEILNIAGCYIEIRSKNTSHCWSICKPGRFGVYPIEIYHKHRLENPVYHLHRRKGTVWGAVEEIKKHDQYQLSGRKEIFQNIK